MTTRTPLHPPESLAIERLFSGSRLKGCSIVLALLFLAITPPRLALAQNTPASFPNKPLKIIVPYSPGGFADSGARAISEALGTRLGQSIVIENKPGASGVIGTLAVSSAAPDGYTLLLGFDGTLITYPMMVSKPPFNVLKDLAAVTKIGDSAMVLAAHPGFEAKSIAQLIDLSKQKDAHFPFGSSGLGSTPHLAGELFKSRTNVNMEHIAYKGGGQATIDALGGQIPMVFTTLATVQQYIKTGKLNAIGVTSAKRLATLPDTPTFVESGCLDLCSRRGLVSLHRLAPQKPSLTSFKPRWSKSYKIPRSKSDWPFWALNHRATHRSNSANKLQTTSPLGHPLSRKPISIWID